MARGPAPYGYRWENGQRVPEPFEQETLTQIQALKAQGLGAVSIANQLNTLGYLCRGTTWHRTTIRRILKRLSNPPLEG